MSLKAERHYAVIIKDCGVNFFAIRKRGRYTEQIEAESVVSPKCLLTLAEARKMYTDIKTGRVFKDVSVLDAETGRTIDADNL